MRDGHFALAAQAKDGLRTGLVRHLERTDLVVWLPLSATDAVSVQIAPTVAFTSVEGTSR